MVAIEWDVFSLPPNGSADPPTYLATLYDAREKSIRVDLNGTGTGQFAINHASPECTEAILAQGNLVRVRIPEIHSDYIFAFFLETGDFTLVSSDEVGGEMLRFGGRGSLCYLEYGVAWAYSYIAGGVSPKDGIWRAYLAGTGHKPGQILMRMIEEMQDPDRPQHPIPLLVPDFDYTIDSNGDPWVDPDATDEFSYQVGEDGLAIVTRLIPTGVTVQMDPDFTLHAYNSLGRNLAGDAFGVGVVRFAKGTNIVAELRREVQPSRAKTHELVAGESNSYGRGVLPGYASMVTNETYFAAYGTGTAALNAIGRADLRQRANISDTITFPIANRRTAAVVLSDPVSIGSPLGPVAADGFYLPGPPGSDNGDFWLGDTVRLHTGAESFDYNEVDARVMAITITRDDDNHELVVIPELEPVIVPAVCRVNALNVATHVYDLPITNTASGFRYYNSFYGSFGDYVASDPEGLTFYPFSGPHWRPAPGAGACGEGMWCGGALYFSSYGFVDPTMPTGYADSGTLDRPAGAAKYQIFVVGPGTMTVYLTDDPQDPPAQGTVEVWRVDITQPTNPSGAPSPDGHTRLSTVALSKPSTTVVVPDDGACLHYVAVVDSASVGQSVGFGGWNWTADEEPI